MPLIASLIRYVRINNTLRERRRPHPFRMTVYYFSEGLKKLRAVAAKLDPTTVHEVTLYSRGLPCMQVLTSAPSFPHR